MTDCHFPKCKLEHEVKGNVSAAIAFIRRSYLLSERVASVLALFQKVAIFSKTLPILTSKLWWSQPHNIILFVLNSHTESSTGENHSFWEVQLGENWAFPGLPIFVDIFADTCSYSGSPRGNTSIRYLQKTNPHLQLTIDTLLAPRARSTRTSTAQNNAK